MADTQQPTELFRISMNPSAETTIIFLHGLFCSHFEFSLVVPYLTDYHLLLVDLPSHSRSRASDSGPFTLTNYAARVASFIRNNAHNGCAHVVGLSTGGFVGMQLAAHDSELVSGTTPFQGYQHWLATHPRALYPLIAATATCIPNSAYHWATGRIGLLPHDELYVEMQLNFSFELVKRGYGEFALEGSVSALERAGVRTLVLVGEVVDARTAGLTGPLLRENGSPESKAVLIKTA
ncbi:hypothetical protein GQX73_g7905 [Xylaria multiplex]|uniref:AB hydrolase-1 domain-containing protein n=1 Tax=Xylaria multiplex TaxID=323545 RepID=A0A7C8N100_9PEZI|nr:hypothetical protein GQX73_g7905 [Xylaria multiplex]